MEGLDRSSLYKNILETMEDKEVEIYRLLQLNITILFKIESFFIFRDADNRSIENKAEINALKFKYKVLYISEIIISRIFQKPEIKIFFKRIERIS